MLKLEPDPGPLPTRPPPKPGEEIHINVSGLPPYKEISASIRNSRHRLHGRFTRLREAAIQAMDGRKWTDGPVSMTLTMYAPAFEKAKDLISYVGGIMDTLDGSHGPSFTYLPIVYQDDSQVSDMTMHFKQSTDIHYTLDIKFHRSSR